MSASPSDTSPDKILAALEGARAFLAEREHWVQFNWFRDHQWIFDPEKGEDVLVDTPCACLMGAVLREWDEGAIKREDYDDLDSPAARFLDAVAARLRPEVERISPEYASLFAQRMSSGVKPGMGLFGVVANWNDSPIRRHEQVLQVLDGAIEKLRQEIGATAAQS